MNKKRRAQLQQLAEQIDSIIESVSSIHMDEEMVLDNIPENLQNSQRYEDIEENVSEMEDAITSLTDASGLLQSVIDRR